MLKSLLMLVAVPMLGWCIMCSGMVEMADMGNTHCKGCAIVWLINEFGAASAWSFQGIVWFILQFFAAHPYHVWLRNKKP